MRQHLTLTLNEMFAVIAIISAFLALIAPGMLRSRGLGRQIACISRLKQQAFAIQNFHDAQTYLPPSRTNDGSLGPTFPAHSWGTLVLPFLEQAPLQKSMNHTSVAWNAPVNSKLIQIHLPSFICPTSPGDKDRTTAMVAVASTAPQGVTDFAPIGEVDVNLYPRASGSGQRPLEQRLGVIEADGKQNNYADIGDGATVTLLLVESSGRPRHYILGKLNALSPAAVTSSGIHQVGWANPLNPIRLNGVVATLNPSTVSAPKTAAEACLVNCTNHFADPGTVAYGGGEMFSFHRGVCNVVFADARTDSLSDTIDITVLMAMATRNGEEIFELP